MRTVWSCVLGLVAVLGCSSTALAFEDRVTIGGGVSYAFWPDLTAAHGVGPDLQVGYGLSEEWQLRGGASIALHPHSGGQDFKTFGARAELVYLIDIVDIVPFGGAGASAVGLLDILPSDQSVLKPSAHLVAGVAYWLSFDWLLQLDVRAHFVADGIDDNPVYLVSTLSLVVALDP